MKIWKKFKSFFLPFSPRFVGKSFLQNCPFVEKAPGMMYGVHIIVSVLS